MIESYFGRFKASLDRFSAMPFVLTSQVSFEARPGDQGYICGEMRFVDGSLLHFREYLDAARAEVDKLMYVYHYRDRDTTLVFRYDNARHRPLLPQREHVHRATGVDLADAPSLDDVLLEIVVARGWA
jgi:hypothetical protein